MSKERTLEGYFACGGQGLAVTTDCLGREFTSRTANYDLIIGLPQLDAVRPSRLLPPQWTHRPIGDDAKDENERIIESDPTFWGLALVDQALIAEILKTNGLLETDGETDVRDTAHISRCRFYTSLSASTDEEFDAAVEDFVSELEDWWTRFTSWVSIVTSQDFERLGGYAGAVSKSGSVSMWTGNAYGQRAGSEERTYMTLNRIQVSPLDLHHLQACVTATDNQGAPPAEWLFIRDARSLLNGGQNRRAVIDAATAAELAMTTLIDKHLTSANTDEIVKSALLTRYSALGGRTALLRRLRSGLLSAQLQRDLIDPRNAATHGGHSLTDAQAQAAVDMAVDIVEEAHPLADLLPTQSD